MTRCCFRFADNLQWSWLIIFDIWYRENVLAYTITFKFCVLFRENVLSYPELSSYIILFQENVLYETKVLALWDKHGGGRSSDSSAQVLRNSRPEFRLLSLSHVDLKPISFFIITLSSVTWLLSLPAPHATLLHHLSQGFPTLHDIDAFRCCVAEISDNLAGCKRVICLYVRILR